jgi:hypothetical protein
VGAAVAAAGEALVAAVGGTLGDEQSAGLGGANACTVRCAELAADPVSGVRKLEGERLSLYVELNVAFRLMAEDADVVPQDESKVSRLHAVKSGCRVLEVACRELQLHYMWLLQHDQNSLLGMVGCCTTAL